MLLLISFVAAASAAELHCEFKHRRLLPSTFYECEGNITTTDVDRTVDSVTGTHYADKSNKDVDKLVLRGVSMRFLPRNLGRWFTKLREYAIANIPDLSTFERSDFRDLENLTYLFTMNLANVEVIPQDTFWDLKKLTKLHLIAMVNMESLHNDLLINAPELTIFSAMGPNKIRQISSGFFRNQVNSLFSVDFRNTNLLTIGHHVFEDLNVLENAFFQDAGCLSRNYSGDDIEILTDDIQMNCLDGLEDRTNRINKKKQTSVTSSSSSDSKENL